MPKTIAAPRNAEELREVLMDRNAMATLLEGGPDGLNEFIENYRETANAHDPDIMAQAREQAERVSFDFLRSHGIENFDIRKMGLHDPSIRATPKRTVYNKNALGAKHDALFGSVDEFLFSISEFSHKDEALNRKLGVLKNDLSSVKPSDGGFLIPETLRAEMLQVALESAVVRSRARVIPMDSLSVLFPAIDSSSNASSVYGGIVGYWTEEGATLTESQPKFGRVKLEAHKLTLYTEVPNELIRDARPAMDAFLSQIMPEALAWFEDVAFFLGGGVGEPLGFLNAPAAVNVDRAGSSSGTVTWADVVGVFCRMLPSSLDRAVWIISPDTVQALLTMPFTSGGTSPILLGGGGFPSGNVSMPMSILGRPVIVSEKARALGTSGDINFVDFGYYLLGDRQAMSARQSEDFRFQNDVTAFRIIERVDGRPWLLSAITPQNGSANTLSAYVKLTTA